MLALPATLSSDAIAALLRHDWLNQVRQANWHLDASSLQTFDSSALALLLEYRRRAALVGQTLTLHGVPPKLLQLAQLYGVQELITA